jgi:hypothetical protein
MRLATGRIVAIQDHVVTRTRYGVLRSNPRAGQRKRRR